MAPLNIVERHDSVVFAEQMTSTCWMKSSLPLHEQAPKRKNVSFAAVVKSCSIIHINDYSTEEVRASWYNREELRNIKAEAKSTANSSDPEDKDVCLRGLEARTPVGARQKSQNRIEARAAVFFEQEIQEEDGYSDPDAIADAYFDCSERCQLDAQMLALRDAREAMEVHRSMKLSEMCASQGRIVLVPAATGSAAA
mmetsp:Transcript_55103/g.154670  ORF Transcript_55103/g.154670 Transcript_55103/m.154670 type:complete len:197 (-) Transcript_55103:30-620(-)|eukprot:CAMPEP_0176250134 /NCGR_PEP_ID=MMETSP0121_2-20121125/34329_1 /TAXON_ID=160619 /ORGANISM="Kryptoperidinium foliaceum, Strain CCMP 1326" /LENGTH=196 /DNA_ID=CAMNT_0017589841 /DNA_START=67 /DNA_END=660 /DNA_ORIENTATION=-